MEKEKQKKQDEITEKRKEFLSIPLLRLAGVDGLGDPNCSTCSGHGCLDAGYEWAFIPEYCPDCYKN